MLTIIGIVAYAAWLAACVSAVLFTFGRKVVEKHGGSRQFSTAIAAAVTTMFFCLFLAAFAEEVLDQRAKDDALPLPSGQNCVFRAENGTPMLWVCSGEVSRVWSAHVEVEAETGACRYYVETRGQLVQVTENSYRLANLFLEMERISYLLHELEADRLQQKLQHEMVARESAKSGKLSRRTENQELRERIAKREAVANREAGMRAVGEIPARERVQLAQKRRDGTNCWRHADGWRSQLSDWDLNLVGIDEATDGLLGDLADWISKVAYASVESK